MNARHRIGLATPITLALWALPAYAQNAQQAGGQSDQEPGRTGHAVNDEIQVYNAEIAKVGQWTIQFHNNYAINGRKEPDFEGGIIPNPGRSFPTPARFGSYSSRRMPPSGRSFMA